MAIENQGERREVGNTNHYTVESISKGFGTYGNGKTTKLKERLVENGVFFPRVLIHQFASTC